MKTIDQLAREIAERSSRSVVDSQYVQDLYPHLKGKRIGDIILDNTALPELLAVARAADALIKLQTTALVCDEEIELEKALQSLRKKGVEI